MSAIIDLDTSDLVCRGLLLCIQFIHTDCRVYSERSQTIENGNCIFYSIYSKICELQPKNILLRQNLLVLLTILSFACTGNAFNVLFLGPFVGTSHFLYCKSFVIELLKRGHQVTFMTSNSMKEMNLANYTEILIEPRFEIEKMSKFRLSKFI